LTPPGGPRWIWAFPETYSGSWDPVIHQVGERPRHLQAVQRPKSHRPAAVGLLPDGIGHAPPPELGRVLFGIFAPPVAMESAVEPIATGIERPERQAPGPSQRAG